MKHEETKKKIKIFGAVALLVGLVCVVIGFVNFFSTAISGDGFPKLFFLLFIGFPLLVIGTAALSFGFRREILRYNKNEGIPVMKEAGNELAPTIKNIAEACREGKSEDTVTCSCGTVNDASSRFCKNCGKELSLSRTCPRCGATVAADSKFCTECGASLTPKSGAEDR